MKSTLDGSIEISPSTGIAPSTPRSCRIAARSRYVGLTRVQMPSIALPLNKLTITLRSSAGLLSNNVEPSCLIGRPERRPGADDGPAERHDQRHHWVDLVTCVRFVGLNVARRILGDREIVDGPAQEWIAAVAKNWTLDGTGQQEPLQIPRRRGHRGISLAMLGHRRSSSDQIVDDLLSVPAVVGDLLDQELVQVRLDRRLDERVIGDVARSGAEPALFDPEAGAARGAVVEFVDVVLRRPGPRQY